MHRDRFLCHMLDFLVSISDYESWVYWVGHGFAAIEAVCMHSGICQAAMLVCHFIGWNLSWVRVA